MDAELNQNEIPPLFPGQNPNTPERADIIEGIRNNKALRLAGERAGQEESILRQSIYRDLAESRQRGGWDGRMRENNAMALRDSMRREIWQGIDWHRERGGYGY
jgi:phage portal protein BeeE